MLRHAVSKASSLSSSLRRIAGSSRPFAAAAATGRQKRALDDEQLGSTSPPGGTNPTPTTPPPTAAATTTTNGGGGGSALPFVVGAVLVGGVGAAYYMDMIPGLGSDSGSGGGGDDTKKDEEKEKSTQESPVSDKVESAEQKGEAQPTPPAAEVAAPKSVQGEDGGNHVIQIALPTGSTRPEPEIKVVDHPAGGNRVAMLSQQGAGEADEKNVHKPTVDMALQELQDNLSVATSRTLSEAHKELAKLSSLDMSEIDNLSPTQLKIRLVQLGKEMEERTKWEAVRLKEFLAMKEKETSEQYIVMMKQQKAELEALMGRKLREQAEEMTKEAKKVIDEKDATIQSVVDNSLKLQQEQYDQEKEQYEKLTEEQIAARYEQSFQTQLAESRKEFISSMQQKVSLMEKLSKKVHELEVALQSSKEFASGSVVAHKMSAAALALAEVLETSSPARSQVAALGAVASNNAVIASALKSLPQAISTTGVATLQELQTSWEESVFRKSRQAAMVPSPGLEGQLLGIAFASLKFPPSPDDPAPESDKDASEYILSRARRHIQLGELEQAVEQLDKLGTKGQVAFTVRDWKQQAVERIAVNKALKVIRMECALTNQNMSKGGGDNE